jgi:uncharacterized membrane protein
MDTKSINESQQPISDPSNHNSPHHSHYREILISRWTAILGALAVGLLYLALPDYLTIGPNWLLLAVVGVLIIPFFFIKKLPHITIRLFALAILAAVTLGLAGSIVLLIYRLPKATVGSILLRSAGLLWFSNILVFALWYWEIDGGGPKKRHEMNHQAVDFMFPQQADGNKTGWVPHFVDYLFVAFTGSTALSPTDTFPLTRRAKLLMMVEAILSLIIIILLAARAVNIYS